MPQWAEDEERVVPEVVVHGGKAGIVHVVVDAGWGSVYDGVHGEVVRMFPSVSVQVSDMLPDIPSQDTVVTVVIEKLESWSENRRGVVTLYLEREDIMAILVWLVVEL